MTFCSPGAILLQMEDNTLTPQDSPLKTTKPWLKPLLLGFAVVTFALLFTVIGYQLGQNQTPKQTIKSTPIASPTPYPMVNWKIYTNETLGFTLKYPSYDPIETFTPRKSGEPIFIISSKFNFDRNTISLCKTYQEKLCLIPGENNHQKNDIQPFTLNGKNFVSFFIVVQQQNPKYTNVIHVIQSTQGQPIEIAMTVDGMGGEETFQQILSTFKFTDQVVTLDILKWKTYQGETMYTRDGSTSFMIKYPPQWKLDKNMLYPLEIDTNENPYSGKNPVIILGAGGHDGPANYQTKNYPAGKAKYYWKVSSDNKAYGIASFSINDRDYIFEALRIPGDKSKQYELLFNNMLTTFKLTSTK